MPMAAVGPDMGVGGAGASDQRERTYRFVLLGMTELLEVPGPFLQPKTRRD